jgi:hypothetical protein
LLNPVCDSVKPALRLSFICTTGAFHLFFNEYSARYDSEQIEAGCIPLRLQMFPYKRGFNSLRIRWKNG